MIAAAEKKTVGEDGDVKALFERLHGPSEALRAGDRESLRDHLVLLHASLVEHCARNFAASGEPVDDLVQEGYVGLIKAVDRFDPGKGVRFTTYACHLIMGEIRHYLRDLGRLIHEPGWHFELRQRIARTNDSLTQKLGRAPEPEEVASALSIEVSSVRDVLRNQQVLMVEYLESETDRDGEEVTSDWDHKVSGTMASSGLAEAKVENQMMLGDALPHLRDLEQLAVTLFFFEDKTKTEIARQLGISVNHAAYLIKRGVDGLRHIIEAGETGKTDIQSLRSLKRAAVTQTRAAYLLQILKNGSERVEPKTPTNRRSTRLVERDLPSAIPPTRSGVATFDEFTLWADEEVRRAARYAQEFSMLWLRVANWDELIEDLNDEEKRRAFLALQLLTRRCCRDTDKIASMSSPELPGLQMLILMPHTGEKGEQTGIRWVQMCQESCEGEDADAENPLPGLLKAQYAFVMFPRDGKSSDELFRGLGQQLLA